MDIIEYSPEKILQLEKKDPAQAEEFWQGLNPAQRLQGVLNTADAKDKLRLILMARDSQALTRELSNDNFVRLALDIGPEDAVELIDMSSDEQLTHLLDLTGWERELLNPARYEAWLPIILEAGPQKVEDWLQSTDLETLTLLSRHWFDIYKYIPSQEQQEPPDDLPEFTMDGVYWLDFHDKDTAAIIAQVLVVLKSELPDLYARLMEAGRWEYDSELEEFARRWRQGRLQDQGFPTRAEALSLWATPKPGEERWQNLPDKYPTAADYQPGGLSSWNSLLSGNELLPQSAYRLEQASLDNLSLEMAFIANCGVVALEADPADMKATRQAALEGLSLVNLGLSILSQDDPGLAQTILKRLSLTVIARQGARAIRRLNQRAWKLVHEGWLKGLPIGFNILDPPYDHWLAGLLFKLPRYYNQAKGPEYRAFLDRDELRQAEYHLTQVEFWGRIIHEFLNWSRVEMLAMLTVPGWPEDPMERKLSQLLATWLARQAMGLPGLQPLSQQQVPLAIKKLQQGLSDGSLSAQVLRSVAILPQDEASMARTLLERALADLTREIINIKVGDDLNPELVVSLVVEQ